MSREPGNEEILICIHFWFETSLNKFQNRLSAHVIFMVYKKDEFSCTSHKILIREKEEEMAKIVPVVKRAKKLWLLFPHNPD